MAGQSTQFFFHDSDPGVGSFTVHVQIWSTDNSAWQSKSIDILGVIPWEMKIPQRGEGDWGPSITVTADMEDVKHGGEASNDEGGGQLRFNFAGKDADGKWVTGWITFAAGSDRWYKKNRESDILDIDWRYEKASPPRPPNRDSMYITLKVK